MTEEEIQKALDYRRMTEGEGFKVFREDMMAELAETKTTLVDVVLDEAEANKPRAVALAARATVIAEIFAKIDNQEARLKQEEKKAFSQ